MAELTSLMIKEYGINSGADVIGIGDAKKFTSAPDGKWVQGDGRKEQFGYISLKHAAEISGLGIIGKNYLLTNPKYGNLLWFSAVLTDAKLKADNPLHQSICDDCNKCVEVCPVNALDDLNSFGKKGCSGHFKIEDRKFKIKCYLCRTVCPHSSGFK